MKKGSEKHSRFHLVVIILALYGGGTALFLNVPKAKAHKHGTVNCKWNKKSESSGVYQAPPMDFGSGMSRMTSEPPAPREGILALLPDDPCDASAPHLPQLKPYHEPSFKYARP